MNPAPAAVGPAAAAAHSMATRLVPEIDAVVQQLLKLGARGVVVQALLPRGPTFSPPSHSWPRGNAFAEPIKAVNAQLRRRYGHGSDPRVGFADCNSLFISPAEGGVPARLMPDGLHPSAEGMTLMAERCLLPATAACRNR
eukprot:TRINITY_DN34822_c0_g1_i1.p2 TRINITY_DN34822_c0_g1~~TRINITY_DN34822_c0_g1_i1.p2  ORF type:complete len:141 (+),score=31.27 TRINITY_DN34822_c0_g1_i1:2-424(+)